jgi:hypothetical protein
VPVALLEPVLVALLEPVPVALLEPVPDEVPLSLTDPVPDDVPLELTDPVPDDVPVCELVRVPVPDGVRDGEGATLASNARSANASVQLMTRSPLSSSTLSDAVSPSELLRTPL